MCSGIEAATQASHPLSMRAAWFAEIEPFPSAVLAHHLTDVPNHGDMTKLTALVLAGKIAAPDVMVGGTPCQAFSVAGMREGLTDPRRALTIKYVELSDAVD